MNINSKSHYCGLRIIIFLIITLTSNSPLYSQELYFIDAHSQVGDDIDLEKVVALMKDAEVRKTILSARKNRKPGDIAAIAETHPDLIVAAVRVKGKHYKANKPKYYKAISKQADSGRFNAIAELHLYHSKGGANATHVEVDISDKRVSAAFDIARENDWPFIIHIEFSALSGNKKAQYMEDMKDFLRKHQDHPVALIHMGQLNPDEVKALIGEHENIYFLTSHSNSITVPLSKLPWVNMFDNRVLTPEWKEIIVSHPTRFIFALDNVRQKQWRNNYREQVVLWRNALNEMPPSVAHAVAHGNAERLWRLD